MSHQITEQLVQHPWLTIISSWLGSSVIGALVAGIYSLRIKHKEYVNEYYKLIINRRVAAYEQLERLIGALKTCVVDEDNRPYHLLFGAETDETYQNAFVLVHGPPSQGLWLSEEAFAKTRELNVLLFQLEGPTGLIEFGKKNYETIATIRAALERSLAKDMLTLHDVKRFLKSKDKPDPGFQPVWLKKRP